MSEDPNCICEGNWRQIVLEVEPLIGKTFVNDKGEKFILFGLVHGSDDYYYGLYNKSSKVLRLLSCVGDLDGAGFKPDN